MTASATRLPPLPAPTTCIATGLRHLVRYLDGDVKSLQAVARFTLYCQMDYATTRRERRQLNRVIKRAGRVIEAANG